MKYILYIYFIIYFIYFISILFISIFYIQQYVYVNPNLPDYSFPFPMVPISLFSTSVTLFASCKYVHFSHFLDFIYKQHCLLSLCLAFHSVWQSWVHRSCYKWYYFALFFLNGWAIVHYIYGIYLSIYIYIFFIHSKHRDFCMLCSLFIFVAWTGSRRTLLLVFTWGLLC